MSEAANLIFQLILVLNSVKHKLFPVCIVKKKKTTSTSKVIRKGKIFILNQFLCGRPVFPDYLSVSYDYGLNHFLTSNALKTLVNQNKTISQTEHLYCCNSFLTSNALKILVNQNKLTHKQSRPISIK